MGGTGEEGGASGEDGGEGCCVKAMGRGPERGKLEYRG